MKFFDMGVSITKTLRRKSRPLRHWALWRFVNLVEWLFNLLPEKTAIRLGGRLGALAWRFDGKDRRLAIEHLERAMGDKMTPGERRRVSREVFVNLGRSAAEVCMARHRGDDFLRSRFKISGEEHIRALVESGRGAVCVTGHIDNWELSGAALARLIEAPTLAVAQRQSDAMIEQWILDSRRRMGMEIHTRGGDARFLLRRLKAGDILCVLLDQDTEGPGCFVPFFGHPAWTLTGPALLAVRAGAPMIVGYSHRGADGLSHHLQFEPPVEPRLETNPELSRSELQRAAAAEMTRRVTEQLEGAIRRAPGQWVWFHRRWKTPPPG